MHARLRSLLRAGLAALFMALATLALSGCAAGASAAQAPTPTRPAPTPSPIPLPAAVPSPTIPAPAPQTILIDSPPEGTVVGSPVTVTGRTARYPRGGVLGFRFTDEAGAAIGSGEFAVSGVEGGPASFVASIGFGLPPQGGPVRLELFERDAAGAEVARASLILFVAAPQAITIGSPAPGTQVGSPMTITGEVARLPAQASLSYIIIASDGRQLGAGSFPMAGAPGRPAYFTASLSYDLPREGDTIQLQLVDQDPASGAVVAAVSLPLVVAPLPQEILIDTPPAGAYVASPVTLTGRTARYPRQGSLGYAIYDAIGAQVGGGIFPVSGSLQEGGRFTASLAFAYPPLGGPLRIDIYDQDPETFAFRGTATINLLTVPLQQTILLETPAPGTPVGNPVTLTGRTARYPTGGVLQYRITDAFGASLGAGSFQVQGPFGEPARFSVSVGFSAPSSSTLRAEVFEVDQFGVRVAAAAADLVWGVAPPSPQIVIETPPPGTLVGSPLTLTGRTNFLPAQGVLSYRVSDSAGAELGVGTIGLAPQAGGARFTASISFIPLPGGGPIFVDIFAPAPGGTLAATARVQLQQSP